MARRLRDPAPTMSSADDARAVRLALSAAAKDFSEIMAELLDEGKPRVSEVEFVDDAKGKSKSKKGRGGGGGTAAMADAGGAWALGADCGGGKVMLRDVHISVGTLSEERCRLRASFDDFGGARMRARVRPRDTCACRRIECMCLCVWWW